MENKVAYADSSQGQEQWPADRTVLRPSPRGLVPVLPLRRQQRGYVPSKPLMTSHQNNEPNDSFIIHLSKTADL